MSIRIDPTAVVSSDAELGDGVVVGPLCVVGGGVQVGPRTRLVASCVLLGPMRIGPDNTVYPCAVLGAEPQDRGYAGEPTTVEIGANNVFREHVTVHRGTTKDRGTTQIGSHNLFMAGAHVTLANHTLVAGHVRIGRHVTTGGAVAIAPFVRIGEGAFAAGGAMIERDVPPWVIAAGDRARVRALNRVGLDRCGVPDESKEAVARAFSLLFRSGLPRKLALEQVRAALWGDRFVRDLVSFMEQGEP